MTSYWLGKKRDPETNKKISEKLRGRKLSKEHVEKIKSGLRKNKNLGKALLGRKLPEEQKRKIREAHILRWKNLPRKEKSRCVICQKILVSPYATKCKVHARMKNFLPPTCKTCGELKSPKSKMCKNCYWKSKRMLVECDYCKKHFWKAKSSQINRKRINTFCSRVCRGLYWKYIRKPEDHPLYRGIGNKNAKLYRMRAKERNPEKYYETKRLNSIIYRFRRRGAGGKITKAEWLEVKRVNEYRCKFCKEKEPNIKLVADHIIPVTKWEDWIKKNPVNYKCGDKENIQPLCVSCNCKKSNKILTKNP